MTQAKKAITVDRMFHMQNGATRHPAAIYRGDCPKKGETLRITLANGVTYSGKVSDATEADGEILAEFQGGLKPV